MDAAVSQTVGLMDELGVERAVLIGHSQGAAVSVLTAARNPERVRALVLIAPPTASKRFRERPLLDVLQRIPQVRHLAPLVPRPFFGRNARLVLSRAYHDPSKLTDETLQLELKATRVKDWDLAYVALTAAHSRFHEPEAMARVSAPTLVVAGRNDMTVPHRDQVRVARSIPNARLVTFESTGHVVPQERPEALAEVVVDFLAEQGC